MKRKVNKGKLLRNVIIVSLLVGAVGVYFANRFVKTKGYANLIDFVSMYRENKKLIDQADTQTVQLIIRDKDYEFLKNQRQEALDRGIQINIGDNYIKCKVVTNGGDTIKGEMRLKGHMTDHLEGDKWSFRVKTDDEVMGMYRFSLQNPGTRNYAYEWVYHQLLKNEDVIHLKYDFIQLKLNEKDLGIYAVEEHFGQHVLKHNDRPKGAILRWNPQLYWEGRIDEFEGTYLDEDYSDFSSSFPEAYDRGVVKRDSVLTTTYVKAAALLEAFRRGEKSTSTVFDIEKMARFHAVIDLVGGYHSLDWSDVKFFYNSETQKIEPVGYESFSVRATEKIAGQRVPYDYATLGFNYHDQLFADPIFFEAYIKALNRICNEKYLNEFEENITAELNKKRGTLAKEFAYIKFSFKPYYENIERIRHNLELPKPLHAFLDYKTDSTVTISVTPVSDFPIEVIGLSIDGDKIIHPNQKTVIPAKARDTFAHYFDLTFKTSKKLKNLTLKAKIPGGKTIFTVEISDLPSYRALFKFNSDTVPSQSNAPLQWVNDTLALLNPKVENIASTIYIPNGKTLRITNRNQLVFQPEAQLIIEGALQLQGTDEYPLYITAKESNTPCIVLKNGNLTAVHTVFFDCETTAIQSDKSKINLQSCSFASVNAPFLVANISEVTATNCTSGSLHSFGQFNACLIRIKNFTANKGNTFLTAYGSDVEMHNSICTNYTTLADLNYSTAFNSWESKFKDINLLAHLNNHSTCDIIGGEVINVKKGFTVDLNAQLSGTSSYTLYKATQSIETLEERKKG